MVFCPTPFNTIHVHSNGYITCCPGWFTDSKDVNVIGQFNNLWDMWNHEKLVRLREAWLNSDNNLCKPCPLLISKNFKNAKIVPDDYMTPIMTRGPKHVLFANDSTCNLHCWSCRSKPIIQKHQDRIFRQTKQVLDTFYDSIEQITTLGFGDPFASPSWLKILQTLDSQKYEKLKIQLFTNGLLLPKYWDSISNIHENVNIIKMSIDAVTPEIYERTRLGGKYQDLKYALEFISKLNKYFILNMVVQADNFTDIPLLIEQAIRYNCSRINLSMLRDWPDIRGGREKFDKENLSNKEHPKHKEFLQLLEDNQDLLNNPIVYCDEIMPEGQQIIRDLY